jgi:glycosyltransferase involved in cell wall biosynthesis
MGSPAATTSVVVSTYNDQRWDDLAACVESLRRQRLRPLETIIVVDHNDQLLERATAAFPEARVIANRRSRGLAGARNTGIEEADGEVLAFIDDDARAEEGWLEELEGCFTAPETVGAGGALLPSWEGRRPGWFPLEFYWVFGCSYTGLPDHLAPVRNPIGANMAVRASVLAEVGGFREGTSEDAPRELRARGVVRGGNNVPDDTDLAIRVKQARPEAVWLYQPRARVLHTVTVERTTLGYFLRRCWEEGIGKASLAGLVGSDDGLASERRHLAAVLPKGVLRELGRLLRGDVEGPLRAMAIVAGTAAAAAGFASVSLRRVGLPFRSRTAAILGRVLPGEPRSPDEPRR